MVFLLLVTVDEYNVSLILCYVQYYDMSLFFSIDLDEEEEEKKRCWIKQEKEQQTNVNGEK